MTVRTGRSRSGLIYRQRRREVEECSVPGDGLGQGILFSLCKRSKRLYGNRDGFARGDSTPRSAQDAVDDELVRNAGKGVQSRRRAEWIERQAAILECV